MSDSSGTNYPLKAFHYSPSKSGAIIAGVVFLILTPFIYLRLHRRKDWWGLCLPIGTLLFSIGFFARYLCAKNPQTYGFFVITQLLIIVDPGTFLAFNYIVYGRIIQAFAGGRSKFSLIRPSIVARIFVLSDVVTFLIQAVGASLSTKTSSAQVGRNVLLLGIGLQTASYALFCLLFIHSHRRFANDGSFNSTNFPWRLVHVVHFSSVFIMVRAMYRLIELIQGKTGYLMTHEVYFYGLDTLPLFLATAIYVFFWPGDMIEACLTKDYYEVNMAAIEGRGA